MNSTKTQSASFPLGVVLFLIFMTLKLCGVITWSWWWVTAPIWAPLLIVLLVFIIVMAVYLIRNWK